MIKTLSLALLVLVGFGAFGQDIQWASKIVNYSSQKERTSAYSARQALGPPNASGYSPSAWTPLTPDRIESIEVGFDKPMRIAQVVVVENYNPGAVYRVTVNDRNGTSHELFRGTAAPLNKSSHIHYIRTELTGFEVVSVKVFLNCRNVPGENQIDAIGIAAAHVDYVPEQPNVADIDVYSELERLGDQINSKYEEVAPVISPDGRFLYVTRKDYPEGYGDDDIWVAELQESGEWGPLRNIGPPLNNRHPNFASSITPDGNMLLLGNQYHRDGSGGDGISISRRRGNTWGFPENVKIEQYANYDRYVSFFLCTDSRTLLMSIEKPGGYGDKDLYVSFMQANGNWGPPQNLGPTINTSVNDMTPFLAADMRTLYFASFGHPGYGSSDIFMSRRLDDTWQRWTTPLNLGPVINSDEWDAYFTVPASGEYAYLVRDGDIYRIRLVPELKPDPVVLVRGTVFDKETGKPMAATILYEDLQANAGAGTAFTNGDSGRYQIALPAGTQYGFHAEAKGYYPVSDNLDLRNLEGYNELERDLYLAPVKEGNVVRLNNIFFEFDKAALLPESAAELDRILALLDANPTMRLEIAGHTDDVGSEQYNLTLSQRRAEAVVKYLTDRYIGTHRLTAKGYGMSQPLVPNDSDENRAVNRRVEFRVLEK